MVIQRSWKTSSSSSSSTASNNASESVANTDDEQHPAAGILQPTTSTFAAETLSPPSEAATSAGSSHLSGGTSSDDSNSSWKTAASASAAASATASMTRRNQPLLTTPQMADSVHRALKSRYCGSSGAQPEEAARRSLDLIRGCVQELFNAEVDTIVRRYVENYFKPALKNVKENLGDDVVSSEDCLLSMSEALMANARSKYVRPNINRQRSDQRSNTQRDQRHQQDSTSSTPSAPPAPPSQQQQQFLNRKRRAEAIPPPPQAPQHPPLRSQATASNTNSHMSVGDIAADSFSSFVARRPNVGHSLPHQQMEYGGNSARKSQQIQMPLPPFNTLINVNTSGTSMAAMIPNPIPKNPAASIGTVATTANATTTHTKQVFWNVSQLNSETLFVLDFRANRALGFGELGKDRLASRHPELIRYLPDAVDKEWLHQQRIITVAHKSSRFLLLVQSEVARVAHNSPAVAAAAVANHPPVKESGGGKTAAALAISKLDSFRVPEFMLHKMKVFFTELSLRSQQTMAAAAAAVAATASMSVATPTNVVDGSDKPMPGRRQQQPFEQPQPSVGVSVPLAAIRSRSTLSSSHATLSALLSNSSTVSASTQPLEMANATATNTMIARTLSTMKME